MKVNLKIFLPTLPEVIGGKELQVEFAGETISDLLEYLVIRYGKKAKQAIYNEKDELDPMVQVLLNGKEWVTKDQLDTILHDGDDILLMMMIAGGC